METTEERRRRRANWFRTGAHAVACVVAPPPPKGYACPLCRGLFDEDDLAAGVVTDEHVPPKSVGGKVLVLTCEACNNLAGQQLDRAVADEERVRTFGRAHTLGPLPGWVSIEGSRNNGSIQFDGETFVMLGEPDQNNPDKLAAHTAALEKLGPDATINVAFNIKQDPIRAGIGWMRSAYLAAFAVYGYRYVLQPAFEPLRAAFADPHGEFEPAILRSPSDEALDPLIAEIIDPRSLAGCLAVVFGPRVIVLPPWNAPENWFRELAERLSGEVLDSLELRTVIGRRFPERPMHLTDG